jgi:ATP-dependent helicase/nuclease subunit B
MVERLWPGVHGQSPWLNLAQQEELGLPGIAQHATLIAHDVLMHGSCTEVFLTYPNREAGSPVARSRYVERLLALAQAQGIPASALEANDYPRLALARYEAAFAPEGEPHPRPKERPTKLSASMLDQITSDPFSIYARSILGLAPLKELDAEPEPRDFGSIAHVLLQQLATHWSEQGQAPTTPVMQEMVALALRDFADRPAVELFWSRRLMQALLFVNQQEEHRRGTVQSEMPIEQAVSTPHGALTLHGRIDRFEGNVIVDYKTLGLHT